MRKWTYFYKTGLRGGEGWGDTQIGKAKEAFKERQGEERGEVRRVLGHWPFEVCCKTNSVIYLNTRYPGSQSETGCFSFYGT